jgi:hypothetical protein
MIFSGRLAKDVGTLVQHIGLKRIMILGEVGKRYILFLSRMNDQLLISQDKGKINVLYLW